MWFNYRFIMNLIIKKITNIKRDSPIWEGDDVASKSM